MRTRYSVERLVDDMDHLYRELLAERDVVRAASSRPGALTPTLPRLSVARVARPLRIILLSQYFPPEVGATQSRMQSFAEYLAAKGHQVTVICEFPNHPHGVIPESYRGHLYEDDRSNPYRVLRVWVKAATEKTQKTRMAFYLSYMALATAMAPVAGRADVVVATSPPLFTGLAGLALARLNRAPFVLDVRDLWPAAAVSLDQIPSARAVQVGEQLERLLYRQAAAVTTVTAPFCVHIDAIRGRPPATSLVPNGTLDLFFDVGVGPVGASASSACRRRSVPRDVRRYARDRAGAAERARRGGARRRWSSTSRSSATARSGTARTKTRQRVGMANVHFHPQVAAPGDAAAARGERRAPRAALESSDVSQDFVPSKLIDFMATGHPVDACGGRRGRLLSSRGWQGGVVVATGGSAGARRRDSPPCSESRSGEGDGRSRPGFRSAPAAFGAGRASRAGACSRRRPPGGLSGTSATVSGPDHPIRVAWVGGEPTPSRVPHLQALAARPEIDLQRCLFDPHLPAADLVRRTP